MTLTTIHADTIDRGPLLNQWQGRIDPEPASLRWHQVIATQAPDSPPGIAIVGFASDEGVQRNHGRVGAQRAPEVLRTLLSALPVHHHGPLYDRGDVVCSDQDLDGAQQRLACAVQSLLEGGHFPVVLGGGHEVAFGSWSGLARSLGAAYDPTVRPAPRIGIVNFDAHFDLRPAEPQATSGTPFSQIAQHCEQMGWSFQYACLGVSRASNTQALFDRAEQLNVWVREDHAMTPVDLPELRHQMQAFMDHCDHLYLTIDLDAFPAGVAPGVSAPAARGIGLDVVEPLIALLRDSGKLRLMDIAELNPLFDVDHHTARLAARLVHWATLNQ
ncbi:MAG: formimidoylglutamase [Natronospirillum sp.]